MDDLISRAETIDAFSEYDDTDLVKAKYVRQTIGALPSAQPDLSEYSDKLWRNAYERGKAEAQAEIIRCWECKHWKNKHLCESLSRYGSFETKADFYCGGAKRKTDERQT